jgi:hypothetical protein
VVLTGVKAFDLDEEILPAQFSGEVDDRQLLTQLLMDMFANLRLVLFVANVDLELG